MKLPYRDFAKAKDFTCLGLWCLLAGPEQHLKREALSRIRDEAGASADDPAWEVLDGPSVSARDLLNRCQTGALFGGSRLIVVQAADRIPVPEQEKLAKAVGPLPAGVAVLLVTGDAPDRGRRRPLAAPLRRAIGKSGLVLEFPAPSVSEAAAWAVAQAQARGKKLEPAAARKLAEQKVGTGLAEMESEVEKLSLFVGAAPAITSADVEEVTTQLLEEGVFRLLDAVGRRSASRAVSLLRGLLAERREDPVRILGLLAHSFRLIWQTKLLRERGWRPNQEVDEETERLLPLDPRKNALAQFSRLPWLAGRTVRQAAAFSWDQLTRALQALLSCDLTIKGIQGKITDPAFALELLVLQLCADLALPLWDAPAGEKLLG